MNGSLRIRSTFVQPDWSSVAQEVASIVGEVQRADDALGYRHLWHLGPEARVSLTAGGMSSSYDGSLLHLCQGLATWLRAPTDDFLWPGESVWQTPDVAIAPGDDGGVTVELGYRPAHRLHTTTDELTREIEQLLRDTATAYREHCPPIARATDMWWLADRSLEAAAD